MTRGKHRIAVVSPFIDKQHGTERRVAEWISRLPSDYEIHVYSQRVEDLDLSWINWHRIPRLPGPHLLNFLWWFAANHVWRWWDRRFRGLRPELVFTPGTNCLDADVISVHIVFAEFRNRVAGELSFRRNHIRFWPRLLHRKLYYSLIVFLERRMYTAPDTQLVLIARKTAEDLKRHYGVPGDLPVVYIGLDRQRFNPESCRARRREARRQLGLADNTFALLLVGNDWKKKGLVTLLESMGRLKESAVCLLVAGQDDPLPYQKLIQTLGLAERVRFLPPRTDVEFYYAAVDAYVGPSLEDTFAQPPAEAMACGLPVITSATNGTAEIISDGTDGLIVQDAADAEELAGKIRVLLQDTDLREQLGANAAQTARGYTWDRNAEQIQTIFAEVLRRKAPGCVVECSGTAP